jgi:7-cyano-7-deazaguanine synthase in queuosine biosynthesis
VRFWLDSSSEAADSAQGLRRINPYRGAATRNTSIDLEDGEGHQLRGDFAPQARDLLDISTTYYRADEMVLRASAPDGWTREFALHVAVSKPGVWRQSAHLVRRSADFLAGDQLRLRLRKSRAERPWYNGGHEREIPEGYDVACLFSGGIDSFAGALQLLQSRKRVLLVGVKVDSNTARYQTKAFFHLLEHFPGQVEMVRLGIKAYPGNPPIRETSHRSRSFLFLASGAAIAERAGIKRLICPENGLLALNIPMDDSRISSFSTRTAHPRFMTHFQTLLDAVGMNVRLGNPHLHQTKAEIVAGVPAAHRDSLLNTTSCSQHGQRWALTKRSQKRVDYCGTCMPCLHRSIAFDLNGLPNEPHFDVRRDFDLLPATRQRDFVAMARLSRRVMGADTEALDAMILAQGHFPPTVGSMLGIRTDSYGPWRSMVRRWSKEFGSFVAEMSVASKAVLDVD